MKLTEIQPYMAANPLASKCDVMRKFGVNQHQLAAWESAGELKFIKQARSNGYFNRQPLTRPSTTHTLRDDELSHKLER